MSSREMLNVLLDEHYANAFKAKEENRPLGWVSSNFPQEFIEAMDIDVVYPENQTAAISAKHESMDMIKISEELGYSNDICGYARTSLGFMEKKDSKSLNMPMPDFLLCCNNICSQLMKWFENISYSLNIPMFLLDIPFNNEYDITESRVEYMKKQAHDLVSFLENISGKKFDEEKFNKVCEVSNETARQWKRVERACYHVPSPANGFHLFNYMALMVCARGKASTAKCIEKYADELEQVIKEKRSLFKGEEKHRVMMEGIACWPYLSHNAKYLQSKGMNVVGSIYCQTWGRMYDNFTELLKSYSNVPDCINLERAVDRRTDIVKDSKSDAMVVHINRSCKIWDGFLFEMIRRISENTDVPYVYYDGDQSDPRCYSEAQFETKIDGFSEMIEELKKGASYENN